MLLAPEEYFFNLFFHVHVELTFCVFGYVVIVSNLKEAVLKTLYYI